MRDLLGEAVQHLQTNGGRMTAVRRVVLETLVDLGGHPTAEQIFTAAKERHPDLNPSTVYRTLNWLAEAGLLASRRFEGGSGAEQFDPGPGEHHHFICQKCGHVTEFSLPVIEEAKREYALAHGCSVSAAELTLSGVCHDCRAASGLAGDQVSNESGATVNALSVSLPNLQSGAEGRVTSLSGGHAFCSRVANLGFTAGAEVTMLQNYGKGPLIVSVRGVRVALGREEAEKVLVQL